MRAIKLSKRVLNIVMIFLITIVLAGCQETAINDNLEGKAGEHVGTLDGYEFYRETYTCYAVIG
ncbi:MAG: hypothetical protein KKH92_04130, partial [Firmicutes bacterium]|nr:hypothetical protein [Bacillota bacterium]